MLVIPSIIEFHTRKHTGEWKMDENEGKDRSCTLVFEHV